MPRKKATPRSPRKQKIPPALLDFGPLSRCVILCVDDARVSGWSRSDRWAYLDSGEIDIIANPDSPAEICKRALSLAKQFGVPCLLVLERPFRGNAQGSEYGTWRNAWLRMGGRRDKVQGVYPSQWRSKSLGSKWVRAKREDVKVEELRRAKEINQTWLGGDPTKVVGPDEAAAVCMLEWALKSPELLKRLPESFKNPKPKKDPAAKRVRKVRAA
jgi:hypothetical protein